MLLIMGLPVKAEPVGAEAELRALERELDEEQALLDQRRQDLQLRKQRLGLPKNGEEVPNNAEFREEDKAEQLARLQAHAQAGKLRSQWMTQWQQAKSMQVPEKTGSTLSTPRAIGRKGREKEEAAANAKKLVDAQIKKFEEQILTSMQTTVKDQGILNDAELKWLESLVATPANANKDKEAAPVTDEATRRWAKLIMELAQAPQAPKNPKDPVSGKTGPILVE